MFQAAGVRLNVLLIERICALIQKCCPLWNCPLNFFLFICNRFSPFWCELEKKMKTNLSGHWKRFTVYLPRSLSPSVSFNLHASFHEFGKACQEEDSNKTHYTKTGPTQHHWAESSQLPADSTQGFGCNSKAIREQANSSQGEKQACFWKGHIYSMVWWTDGWNGSVSWLVGWSGPVPQPVIIQIIPEPFEQIRSLPFFVTNIFMVIWKWMSTCLLGIAKSLTPETDIWAALHIIDQWTHAIP